MHQKVERDNLVLLREFAGPQVFLGKPQGCRMSADSRVKRGLRV